MLHNGVLERLIFPGWRGERVGGLYAEGRVVIVQPGDPPYMWRKVREALHTVDRYRTHSACSESRRSETVGSPSLAVGYLACKYMGDIRFLSKVLDWRQ